MKLKKYYLLVGVVGLALSMYALSVVSVPKDAVGATTVPLGKNGTSQYLIYPTDSLSAAKYIATGTDASVFPVLTSSTGTLTTLITDTLMAETSGGSTFKASNGTPVSVLGVGNSANVLFYGGVNIDGSVRLATSLNGLANLTNGTVSAIATSSLGLPTFSTLDSYLSLASWYATTTDGLDEGTTNKYDKTVAFTNGTNVSMTGTYPNFTIADSVNPLYTSLTATRSTTTNATTTNLYVSNSINLASGCYSVGGVCVTGITRSVVVTSGNVNAGNTASTDYVYVVAGAHTVSLPAASGNTNRYTIKNSHSADITVDTVGAETIDGTASITIAPEDSVDIISDGTNFIII